MSLAAGTFLGPYEVIASLGSGGMAEVYRARDRSRPISGVRRRRSVSGHPVSYISRHADALAPIARANPGINPNFVLWKAMILARAGRVAEARAIAERIDDEAKVRYFPPYYRAMLHAALGHRDVALSLLEQTKRNGDWQLLWAAYDPGFDVLRNEPRFAALLR